MARELGKCGGCDGLMFCGCVVESKHNNSMAHRDTIIKYAILLLVVNARMGPFPST